MRRHLCNTLRPNPITLTLMPGMFRQNGLWKICRVCGVIQNFGSALTLTRTAAAIRRQSRDSTSLPKCQETAAIRATTRLSLWVKCKFPLSELRGEATYYTHRAVAGSRFPSTIPLHLKESFEYRFYTFHVATRQIFAVFHDKTGVVVLYRDSTRSAL